jgi:hypothetical protein
MYDPRDSHGSGRVNFKGQDILPRCLARWCCGCWLRDRDAAPREDDPHRFADAVPVKDGRVDQVAERS